MLCISHLLLVVFYDKNALLSMMHTAGRLVQWQVLILIFKLSQFLELVSQETLHLGGNEGGLNPEFLFQSQVLKKACKCSLAWWMRGGVTLVLHIPWTDVLSFLMR